MSNKTISFNTNLFKLGGTKTKKNRDKKQKPNITPLISPNVLKNKLLKRIKEHKNRETENLVNNTKKIDKDPQIASGENKKDEKLSFSDEFSDSINYLQTLSKQKKVNDEKDNYEKNKQKRIQELERKTIKNYNSLDAVPYVNLDLPEELKITNIDPIIEPIQIKQHLDNVPYGILKGGSKPTYRDWNRTHRSHIVTNPNNALLIEGSELNREKNKRETHLENLRKKIKHKQLEVSIPNNDDIMLTKNLIHKPTSDNLNTISIDSNVNISPKIEENKNPLEIVGGNIKDNGGNIRDNEENIIAIKKTTKKTIKRKYTLGKSKIKKTIGVLVKDRGTRKKIINAQKDLKKKPINDIKIYLRDHNLIKTGSGAPNDVLRKMYESAMLAGEITNSNKDILLHNFSKEDKEL